MRPKPALQPRARGPVAGTAGLARLVPALLASVLLVASPRPAVAAPARVGVAGPLVKVRPGDPAPGATSASLAAARNEFEPFQIAIEGGDGGVSGVTASASDLTGPSGMRLSAANVTLYRVGLYPVVTPSNTEGAVGPWPDPLIPDVDTYVNQTRNAFPFDVPAGDTRAIWVEIFVPPGTAPGDYAGSVSVAGTGLAATTVPVSLRVRAFDLPSTATLKSAFGMGWSAACVAHLGSYAACGDAGVESFHLLYARAALDHRVSLETVVYDGPHDGDWTHFDSLYGPLLDGSTATRLAGARLTSIRLVADPIEMGAWHDHFAGRGWLDRLFDYTCDEPPATCSWSDIPARAAAVHAAGLRTLVTTDIDAMIEHGLLDDIDIATPVVNYMHDKGGPDRRPEYDGFLAGGSQKELWWYQSCMSHGCGGGCVGTSDAYFTGWPSYMIDSSAIQHRAMEWLSWSYRVTGELYFETQYMLPEAWSDQCDFSGNGDGTLFYPGTPARIGGVTDIPVESIRLKLIREGMEDYEYLALLATLGDGALADAEAEGLFPAPYLAAAAAPDDLFAARARLGDRIEELIGVTPPERPKLLAARADGPVAIDGAVGEFTAAPALEVRAGAAVATFRLLWDDSHLYVAVVVADPDLAARGVGRDGDLWDADGVELLLDPALTRTAAPDADDRHVIVTAAGDLLDAQGAGATEDRALTMGVDFAVAVAGTLGDGAPDTGYTVELAIPWTALGVTPAASLELGADLAVNDATTGGALASGDWAGLSSFARPDRWNVLALAPPGGLPGEPDGGNPGDGGPDPTGDGGPGADDPTGAGGCGCHAGAPAGRAVASLPAPLLAAAALLLGRRRRRAA